MYTRYIILIIFILFLQELSAQIGGQHIYQFLNLSPSARVSALGGSYISVRDDDINLAYVNPAVLNPEIDKHIAINSNFYFTGTGIMNGYAAYARHIKSLETTFHAAMQFINYGQFDLTDVNSNIIGNFNAGEYALVLGASRNYTDKISYGVNLKLISSQLESYNSFGIVLDLGGLYYNPEKDFGIGLVLKNIGTQLSSYVEGNPEPLPFDMQLGISKKLQYLPFRFSVTLHHLHQWNITYDDPSLEDDTIFLGDTSDDTSTNLFVNNLFRHFIFAGEFLFGENENLRFQFGYNHLRRAELSINDIRSLAGFNFGLGVKVKRFRIEYGRAIYHIAGGTNHFSIILNGL